LKKLPDSTALKLTKKAARCVIEVPEKIPEARHGRL
jgi:hypothetical protein